MSSLEIDFKTMSPDFHHYISQQSEKLKIIRDEVQENAIKVGESMKERENQKTNHLRLDIDDYVYMLKDPTGPGRILKPKYSGPYVVDEIKSPHLVTLRDKSTGKLFKNPVHLERLKIAYVRAPNQGNFFLPRVTTHGKNRQDDEPSNTDLIKLSVPANHKADSSFILNPTAAEQGTESNSLSELDEPSEPVI